MYTIVVTEELPKFDTGSRVGGAMKSLDLVFVDTETTGLDPKIHELIEIGFVRVRQIWAENEQPKFEVVEEWSKKIKPEHIEVADPISLKINGYTVTGWQGAFKLEEVMREFSEKTNEGIMVAHNVSFDAGFIDMAYSKCKIRNTMHYHRLDTVSMAFAKLHNTPDVTRYSLGELCKNFGIIHEDAHSALSDARACYELFKKLIYI